MGEPMNINGPSINRAPETKLTETENELYDRLRVCVAEFIADL